MKLKRYVAGMLALLLASSAAAQTNSTPVFQFAIFYNSLLEFVWCGDMTVNGRTHANGDIYVGSIRPLVFNGLVTKAGQIVVTNWFGHSTSQYTDWGTFNGGYSTNGYTLMLPLGITDAHEIINLPPDGEDPTSPLGQQHYYNKAKIVLLVSNSTATVTLKNSPSDPAPTIITANYYPTNSSPTNYSEVTSNFPFLAVTTTNTFTDQREGKTIIAADIDMSKLKGWLVTNPLVNAKFPNTAGLYTVANAPNILYVADNRTNSPSQLTAVRLLNGQIIPTNMVTIYVGLNQPSGFTVATPNPLYVWGNYNCPDLTALGTTNTTAAYPASLVSDALTILSGKWQDPHSNDSFSTGVRVAKSTTVNAALLTGVVYSTGSGATQYSGGVQNQLRLLEDWGNGSPSVVLTLNTSIVNLFNSVRATNQFRAPGAYYYSPVRQFSFDPNFLNPTKLPPGTPLLFSPSGPAILISPHNQTVCAGQTAAFSVGATGSEPLVYQWRFNGTNIPNARDSTLLITSVNADNVGSYSVVVTNALGNQTSPNAALTINYPAVINTQPVSQAVLPGSGVTFSVSADGTAPLSYQWFHDQTNAIAGATGSSLNLNDAQPPDAGSYSVLVSNACGPVTSKAASLTVCVAPAISTPPQSLMLLAGQNAVFNVGATGTAPLIYQWQFNGTNLVNATQATLSLPSVTTGQAGVYGVTVTNLFGLATASATMSVYSSTAGILRPTFWSISNQFQLTVTGFPGSQYTLEASTNLVNWVALCTNTAPFTFVDGDAANSPARYYRSIYGACEVAQTGPIPTNMALIAAGSITIGDTLDGSPYAIPTNVYVSAFYMDTNLVSYGQWQTVYDWATNAGYSFDYAGSGKAVNHPVQTVDWYDVVKWSNARSQQESLTPVYYTDAGLTQVYTNGATDTVYANWAVDGYRLPTEAEWEKAARGGVAGHRFPWADTDTIDWNRANYCSSSSWYTYDVNPTGGCNPNFTNGGGPGTSPVGYFAPNGYGLYDMSGNVWEWCWNWEGMPYAGGSDPRGLATGTSRVVRGGSWDFPAIYARCACRFGGHPYYGGDDLGFRCVRGH